MVVRFGSGIADLEGLGQDQPVNTTAPSKAFFNTPVDTHDDSDRKHLSERLAGKPCSRKEAVQTLSVAGASREPRHRGADKVSEPIGLKRVALSDAVSNEILRSYMESAGGLARVRIVAPGAFQHHTAGGCGVGSIASRSLFQHLPKRISKRPVSPQDFRERERTAKGISI